MQSFLSSELSKTLKSYGAEYAQPLLKSQSEQRNELIAEIKETRRAFLKEVEAHLIRQKDAPLRGIETGQQIANWHDQLLQYLAQLCFPVHANICLIAVGGYGFGNLCAGSDLDLLFLGPKRHLKTLLKDQIETFLYLLWDAGFKVGHATRNVAECVALAREDHSICAAMLTRRKLFGSARLDAQLRTAFDETLLFEIRGSFVEKKFAERKARHEEWGGSRYALEPNVKESKGGLRDLDCLIWIARAYFGENNFTSLMNLGILTPSERNATRAARDFLLAVRHQLHFMTRGRENRLLFDHQEDVAGRLGYVATEDGPAAVGLMRDYFRHARTAGELTRILSAALEQSHKQPPRFSGWKALSWRKPDLPDPFLLSAGRLDIRENAFEGASNAEIAHHIVSLFRLTQTRNLNLHPNARRLVWSRRATLKGCLEAEIGARAAYLGKDPSDMATESNLPIGQLLRHCLCDQKEPDEAVRKMSEAGCLGEIIPEWAHVEIHPQFDRYHSYTVGEHTIQVIKRLSQLEAGQLTEIAAQASSCIKQLNKEDREILYVAAFLHDMGKGYGVDHAEKGAEIAARIAPLLGFDEDAVSLIVWLVRHHLALSNAALKRDPDSPETAHALADLATSSRWLDLLLVLTTADIMGVAPGCWTAWKESQIKRIYSTTLRTLRGQAPMQQEAETKAEMDRNLASQGWNETDRNRLFETAPKTLWATLSAVLVASQGRFSEAGRRVEQAADVSWPLKILALYRKAFWQEEAPALLGVEMLSGEGGTLLAVCGKDRPGLLADLAGAIAYAGLGIHSMRLNTFSDGGVLDVFAIFGRSGALSPAQETRLRNAIHGQKRPKADTCLRRALPGTIPTRVQFDTPRGATYTLLEITAQDRPGLTHDLARILERHQLRIHHAQTTIWGERSVQTYYVRDRGGRTVETSTVKKSLAAALRSACSAAS